MSQDASAGDITIRLKIALINCISGHIVTMHFGGDIMNSILDVRIDH